MPIGSTFGPPYPDSLPELFEEHDIYVFPSLYEPFSLTLIHALACGIPTAASRVGGNVEIVRDGVSGVLFKKGDPADWPVRCSVSLGIRNYAWPSRWADGKRQHDLRSRVW